MAEEILNTESEETVEEVEMTEEVETTEEVEATEEVETTEEIVETEEVEQTSSKSEVADNSDSTVCEGEMLRYQANKGSYWFGMLAVASSLVYLFVTLNCFTNFTGILMFKILGNIILFLAGFLCCEKMKTYDLKWGYVAIAFGILAIVRAFVFPIFIISGTVIRTEPRVALGIFLIVCMIVTAILYVFAGITSIKKTKVLNDYLISINEPRNI